MNSLSNQDRHLIAAVFARMDVIAMSIAMAVLCACALFLATAVLLLVSGPNDPLVGMHLRALGEYLPGYSVSWLGALVGLGYGFVVGLLVGAVFAIFWNIVHYFMLVSMMFRNARLDP